MRQILIFDADNCLSDDGWRIPLIDFKQQSMDARYHNYHLASAFDTPGNLQLLKNKQAEDVFIFTAMPERYRVLRELWFNSKRIGINHIFMRANGDHRKSVEVKRDMLRELLEGGISRSSILAAYDDRKDVVDMYVEEHVNGKLLSIHNLCAETPPKLEK